MVARRLRTRGRISEGSGVAHRKFLSTPKDPLICVMGNHLAADSTEARLFEASRICRACPDDSAQADSPPAVPRGIVVNAVF